MTPVTGATQFLNTPGQASFTPDGDHLIVTTKANGSRIDVFRVRPDGLLSAAPVINPSATPVPFGLTFDRDDHLVVAEAGSSAVSTYRVRGDGRLMLIASRADGQAALCWIARADGAFYVANAGSGTLSGYRIGASGTPSLIGQTGVVASPGGGPIDLAASRGGEFVYAQLGGTGAVVGYRVNHDGTLTPVGSVAGQVGMEGIAAT